MGIFTSCNFVQYNIEKIMIRSISLCNSTLEDSSKIYLTFFGAIFHFLGILEVTTNF
jgi:hypothetical protein